MGLAEVMMHLSSEASIYRS